MGVLLVAIYMLTTRYINIYRYIYMYIVIFRLTFKHHGIRLNASSFPFSVWYDHRIQLNLLLKTFVSFFFLVVSNLINYNVRVKESKDSSAFMVIDDKSPLDQSSRSGKEPCSPVGKKKERLQHSSVYNFTRILFFWASKAIMKLVEEDMQGVDESNQAPNKLQPIFLMLSVWIWPIWPIRIELTNQD